jgi:nucleotide-binding universal stress UspA family protein
MHFSSILIPTDFSEASKAAFELAAYDKKMEGSEIILLYVNPVLENCLLTTGEMGIPLYFEENIKAAQDLAEKKLNEIAKENFHGQKVRPVMISAKSSIAEEICSFAEKEKCDLIVIGSRGHSPLGNFFLGSVTQRVLLLTKCPVLVVPPKK